MPPVRPLLVADRDIPFVEEFFASVVRVRLLPAAEISSRHLVDADALLVRSGMKVNERLLGGSSVRFVATATTGTDHLDLDWLRAAGLGWASGAGGNARAVAEYVLAAIGLWLQQQDRHIAGLRCGLIGCGRIGGLLRRMLRAAGAEVLAFDPVREDCAGVRLQQVLDCDLVSLHVPLSHSGRYPTRHMLCAAQLQALGGRKALFINTARGEVIAPDALPALFRHSGGEADLVLDVWPDETAVPADWVRSCTLCSAHLAGHTLEARLECLRLAATAMVEHLGVAAAPLPPQLQTDGLPPAMQLDAAQIRHACEQTGRFGLPVDLLATAVPLQQMKRDLLHLAEAGGTIAAADFRHLRQMPPRRQLSAYRLLERQLPPDMRPLFHTLGLHPG